MEFTTEYDRNNNICSVLVTGELHSPEDSFKLQHAAIDIQAKQGCSVFLFDLTQAEIISETISAYQTANIQGELATKLMRLKVAFLYSKLAEQQRFFETVGINRGFQIKVFDNQDEAIAWLLF